MNYSTFKNELRNLYSYERELSRVNDLIDNLSYAMTGVKGINYSKIPASTNPQESEEKRLEQIDDLEELLTEKQRLQLNIRHIYITLSRLDDQDRDAMIEILVKKVNAEKVAEERGYSRSGIWARIKREIEKL